MLRRFKIEYLLILFILNILSECIAIYSDNQQCLSLTYQSNYSHIEEARIDVGWLEYLNLVYDSMSSSSIVDQKNFLFYYMNSNIRVISLNNINPTKLFPSSRFVYKDNEIQKPLSSYQWVEVIRFHVNKLFNGFPTEGYTAPNWTINAPSPYSSPIKVPYGCWFYFASGSGIYINIGNTLVILGKYKEMKHRFAGDLNSNGCIPSDNAKNCYDKYYCSVAISKGIQQLYCYIN